MKSFEKLAAFKYQAQRLINVECLLEISEAQYVEHKQRVMIQILAVLFGAGAPTQ